MSVHPDEAPTTAYATDRRVALSDLYRSEYAGLVRLACLLVDQREVAEELVQEAFVRLDRSWDRVQDPAARPAYLRSIVMNLARSSLRRRLVARRHRPAPAPDAAPAEDHAVLREDQAEVLDAVPRPAGPPARVRRAALLRRHERGPDRPGPGDHPRISQDPHAQGDEGPDQPIGGPGMNGRSPTSPPAPEGTEARLRDALGAYADTVDPADAWPAITERLGRRSAPLGWVRRHPMALGAVAAAVVLIVALGIATLTADPDQDLDLAPVVTDPPAGARLVGITADARVVTLDPAGTELVDHGDLPGGGEQGQRGALDGGAAVVATPTGDELVALVGDDPDAGCPASDQVLTDLVRLPLVDPDVSGGGAGAGESDGLSQVSAVAASPTGDLLAVTRHPGEPCAPGQPVIEILGAADGEVLNTIPVEPLMTVRQMTWLSDGRLFVLVQMDPEVGFLTPIVVNDPTRDNRLAGVLPVPVPFGTRVAAAPGGQVWLAGHLDARPLDGSFDDVALVGAHRGDTRRCGHRQGRQS